MFKIGSFALVSLCAILLTCGFVVNAQSEKSVSVGGHTFTTSLDGWRVGPHIIETADTPSDSSPDYDFKGIMISDAFWLPRDKMIVSLPPDSDITDSKQKDILASVDIRVNTVPNDERNWAAKDVLSDLYGPLEKDASQKDIEFENYPAYLVESDKDLTDGTSCSFGTLEILISKDTIVELDVVTRPESDLRAWDVISSIAVK